MRAYTLRGIDDKLYRVVRERSRSAGKSMNRFMLEIIACGAGVIAEARQSGAVKREGADKLFGCLSGADREYYRKTLADQRKIDPEMWS
ncbi:MAG: hypothetical protein HQL20_10430 [Candidatus Omnitrophica bacterium]|nr:hypothetical protein [Candidatus Omnitrophota bacterium]